MATPSHPAGPPATTDLRITVVGGGHVGLVSAVAFAALGNRVCVYDVDRARIDLLSAGKAPFVEPDLDELLASGLSRGALSFHLDPSQAIREADVVFVCVDTPNSGDGSVDLRAIVAAARTFGRHATEGSVLVNRSTAPVGTSRYVRSIVEEEAGMPVRVAVNPEFLAEGTAVRDFFVPDRLVCGVSDATSLDLLLRAYGPIVDRRIPLHLPRGIREKAKRAGGPVPVVTMDPSSAELSKYAANAFLAVKISFINEIANIAEDLGADIGRIAEAVGQDRRIGPLFLRAGIGWGGSCFPKDVLALQGMAETRGLSPRMLRAANDVNRHQQRWVVRQLQRHLRTLVGRRIGFLGLAFKPGTDDLRNAPALEIAAELGRLGARVRGFDPVINEVPEPPGTSLEIADSVAEAALGAEALVLLTEWPEFSEIDPAELRRLVRVPLVLDGRNFLHAERWRAAGFSYAGVGRGGVSLDEDGMAAPNGPVGPVWVGDAVDSVGAVAE